MLNLASCAAALSLCLAACGPLRPVTPVASSTTIPLSTATMTGPGAGQPPQLPGAASAQPSAAADLVPASLRVLSPQDEAVVNASQIDVTGTASPGEVVTVNDYILIVGADGTFTASVALEAGPNLIEVIASNDSGSESVVDLTVIFEP
jgi:hypothetical protein